MHGGCLGRGLGRGGLFATRELRLPELGKKDSLHSQHGLMRNLRARLVMTRRRCRIAFLQGEVSCIVFNGHIHAGVAEAGRELGELPQMQERRVQVAKAHLRRNHIGQRIGEPLLRPHGADHGDDLGMQAVGAMMQTQVVVSDRQIAEGYGPPFRIARRLERACCPSELLVGLDDIRISMG